MWTGPMKPVPMTPARRWAREGRMGGGFPEAGVGEEGDGGKAKSSGDCGVMCVLAGGRGAGMIGVMMTTHYGRKDEDPDDDVPMEVKFCVPARSNLALGELGSGEAEGKR